MVAMQHPKGIPHSVIALPWRARFFATTLCCSHSNVTVSRPLASNTRAYALLSFTALCWAGNMVAARLAVGEVSPMTLTFFRWVLCFCALWLFARRDISAHWRTLVPRWRYLALMGSIGLTAFGGLLYVAASHTSGVNLSIIQGAIPIFVIAGGFLFLRVRSSVGAMAGVALTLLGIVWIATRGQPLMLADMTFNVGDLYVLAASLCYAGYALGLPRRPQVPAIVFFAALCLVGAFSSVGLFVIEAWRGEGFMPSLTGLAILAFVGIFPSFVAQLFFMRGVALIGPGRAGLFINLVPVFGAVLSVLILGEPFETFHAVALACVLGGIYLAERGRSKV